MNPEHKLCYDAARCGEVAEWSNVPDSKSGVPQGTVGSNPTLSASLTFVLSVIDSVCSPACSKPVFLCLEQRVCVVFRRLMASDLGMRGSEFCR